MNNQVEIIFDPPSKVLVRRTGLQTGVADNGLSMAGKSVEAPSSSTDLSAINNREKIQLSGGSRKVNYAGQPYEVIYEGERVLHLKSVRDPKLKIHCSSNSPFLTR
jgi:hypothetical protein